MARQPSRKPRLFDPGTPLPKQKPAKRHLHAADPPSAQVRLPARDGLVPGTTDGLPVRLVKPHSAQKAKMVRSDLGIVGQAMNRKWFDVQYLELYSGPGLLYDDVTSEEVPGSPLEALAIRQPFDRYVFSDFTKVCTDTLRTRIGSRDNVAIRQGDANDPKHLEAICSLLDPKALVIAYLDPAKPNLHFSTVRYLAERFKFIDFIINLPFSGIHRSMAAGGYDLPGLMLNHPEPKALLDSTEGKTAQNIRDYYDDQLRSLGLIHIARRCVKTVPTNSPLYDIVLASRHPLAVELWDKANKLPPPPPQLWQSDFAG
jgi:three-Cys-motif partner protein